MKSCSLKKVKVLVLLVALGLIIHGAHPIVGSQEDGSRLGLVGGESAEERVGVDDGMLLAIHFAGDTRGNLEECG